MKELSIEDLAEVAGGGALTTAGKWMLNQLAGWGFTEAVVEGVKYVMDNEGGWFTPGAANDGGGSSPYVCDANGYCYTNNQYSCSA